MLSYVEGEYESFFSSRKSPPSSLIFNWEIQLASFVFKVLERRGRIISAISITFLGNTFLAAASNKIV